MAENARQPDFTGWATKSNLQCTDGRTIMPGAFKHMDKKRVPLVYMHRQLDPENVLGHAILEDRAFGTYAQGFFNHSDRAKHAKAAVDNGDLDSLSIYANDLSERAVRGGKEVYHGNIIELSLVLAGANPGAKIEHVNLLHADGSLDLVEEEAVITTGLYLNHSYEGDSTVADTSETTTTSEAQSKELDKETIESIFATMTEEQRNAALYVAGAAFEAGQEGEADADDSEGSKPAEPAAVAHSAVAPETNQTEVPAEPEGILAHVGASNHSKEGTDMTGINVFDQTRNDSSAASRSATLSHAQQADILRKSREKGGKLSEFVTGEASLAHAGVAGVDYGVTSLDLLFPDYKADGEPSLLTRRVEWVSKVLNGVKKQPFAKIKSLTFDITADEARAKGYVKGTQKKEEVVKLLKRTTGPTTVYKKQKLDRDDILDITEFDIVAWLKWEIRYMLDEEIARAILIGDGRSADNPDKIKDPEGDINGDGIRSILHDHEMYAERIEVAANTTPEDRIEAITRSRSLYRGSGTPTFYTTDAELTDMLLLKDKVGRRLYGTEAELASVLRVKEIVAVEVMGQEAGLLGIVVNLVDYTVGANRGGELTFFEQFDIDWNQEKYLMETRISGALNKPKSAIVLTRDEGTSVTPGNPSFNGETDTITVPTTTGVIYMIDGDPVTGSVVISEPTQLTAVAASGYYIPAGTTRIWSFTPAA